MKVLDATFLIDYLDEHPATAEFYEESGGDAETWAAPTPAFAEVLVGAGNRPDGDPDETLAALEWVEVFSVDRETAKTAAEVADAVGDAGPHLDGPDGLIAAVGRELGAPVVSSDQDLTHPETKAVLDVEEYR